MALHHRREIADMRSAYDHDDTSPRSSASGSDNDSSYEELHSGSDRSYHTQTTSYSGSPPKRPPHVRYNTCDVRYRDIPQRYFDDRDFEDSPESSVQSIASTVDSEDEEEFLDELPEYDLPEYTARQSYEPRALAATPSDFSDLFPSDCVLKIRHDDSTLDGNMNLRLDTQVQIHGRKCDMTLFHLRMHDLKNREFSLRRYCRDSGREVCKSTKKPQKSAGEKRPGFQRSLSNALHSMRPRSSDHRSSTNPTLASLQRNDSGYESIHSTDGKDDDRPRSSAADDRAEQGPTNNIKLEFSNYAQVDVKRSGVTNNKRYEFEYWGVHYAWRRISRKQGGSRSVAFHLTKAGSEEVLAYVVPIALDQEAAQEERSRGGWIPPCSMQIKDEKITHSQKDVSDVVVAAGLMALVDDSIRTTFQNKNEKQILIPVPKIQMGVEYIGPKRLINEMFNRKDSYSSQQSRPASSSGRPSTSTGATIATRRPAEPARTASHHV